MKEDKGRKSNMKNVKNKKTRAIAKQSPLQLLQSAIDWKIALIVVLALVAVIEFTVLFAIWNSTAEKPINVLVIGTPSQTMLNLLYSEDYKIALNGEVKSASDAQVTQDDFKKANVVIMQGEEYCDNALSQYVASLNAKDAKKLVDSPLIKFKYM